MSPYRVILYATVDDVADPRNRFHARVLEPQYAPETAPGRDGFAPVYFRGATAQEATDKANDYIAERETAIAAKHAKRPKRADAPAASDKDLPNYSAKEWAAGLAPQKALPDDDCGEFF